MSEYIHIHRFLIRKICNRTQTQRSGGLFAGQLIIKSSCRHNFYIRRPDIQNTEIEISLIVLYGLRITDSGPFKPFAQFINRNLRQKVLSLPFLSVHTGLYTAHRPSYILPIPITVYKSTISFAFSFPISLYRSTFLSARFK